MVFAVATFHFSVLGFCTSVRIGCHRPSLFMAARPSVDVEEWQDPRLSADIKKWQAGYLWIHGWPGSTVGPEQIQLLLNNPEESQAQHPTHTGALQELQKGRCRSLIAKEELGRQGPQVLPLATPLNPL